MIPEIGHFALVLALVMALVQSVLPLWGAQTGHSGWMRLATPAATAQCLLLLVAYACLTQAFVASDFSVKLAAQHSHTALPLVYRITAVWGNHEGSILLWSLVLSLWTFAVAHRSAALDLPMRSRVLGVMGLISVGFLLFTLFTSNPFLRLDVPPLDGQDLNPLLQDPGMAIHPPMLYMGYVGFVVAFAFAVAALLAGRLDAAWAHWSRPWTLLAWMFLTIGIALGSFWAYYELGWGGWWFWDPVENASFMPWLVGTALIHSLSVSEKRGAFRRWTVLLAILAFSLSLLGTFIVRSGVLSSVHAFATDPARGVFILAFLAVVVGGSLALFAWRAPAIGAGDRFEPVSRESFLLANNVLLLSAAAAVLLGTLYPLIIDALGLGKLSVGPPYFQAVFVPLMAPALFLMGLGPLARWRSAQPPDLALRLRAAAAVAVAGALLAALVLGVWTPMSALGLLMAAWVAASTLAGAWQRLHDHPGPGWRARLGAQSGAWWGLQLAHLGVAVFVAGVTVVSSLSTESDVRMEPGQTVEAGGHRFTLRGVELVQGPNYTAGRATIDVVRDGQAVATLRPERRIYTVSRMPMTEVAIDRGVLRDLYVALGEPVSATAWSVRLHHKPLVNWIWGGCLLMALGGLLAAADRRYRTVRLARTAGAAGVPARPTAPGQKGFA